MALGGISTYAVFQSTLSDISRTEQNLTQAQMQLSSGMQSQDFAGMSAQVEQYLSLNATISRTDQYLRANQSVETRINTTATAIDQVITTANSLQNLISQRRTSVANNAAFPTQVEGLWKTLVQQLNVQTDGQFLFGGSKTNTPPVDPENFPELFEEGVADEGYYQGSKQNISVRVNDNTEMTYSARADGQGFKDIFAALAMAKEGHDAGNDDYLARAYELVQSGLQGVITTQATVNASKVQIATVNTNHQSVKLYWKGVQESINNTDIVAVSTQVAINQGILQAAFQAFAKINSLRLSDFLQ